MKNKHTALLLVSALVLTMLCACSRSSGQTKQQENGDGDSSQTSIQETHKPLNERGEERKEVTIIELYSEEGEGISDDGFTYSYSFHVPQIEDDTQGAAAINQEIVFIYGESAEVCLESVRSGEIPYLSSLEYESFHSGDILSLVLKYAYFYDGFEGYTVYSYNTATGEMMTTEDILKTQGMTEADYLSALRRAAVKEFDDDYHASCGEFSDIDSFEYQRLRSWTLSEQNLSTGLPLYPDDGVIHVIAPIGSFAGTEYMNRDLTLAQDANAGDEESTQLGDYLTVKRQGNTVTLQVRQTTQLEYLIGEVGLVDGSLFDKELTVDGLYGSYTKLLCGEIGDMDEPFVFLLTEEGRVDYIDVLSCLRGGTFCGDGPLLGVTDVKNLVQSSADGLPDVCAVAQSDEQTGLWDIVSCQRYTIPQNLQNSAWWNDETGGSLTVSEGTGGNFNYCIFRETGSVSAELHGILNYLGMTEKGMVYAYRLWGAFSDGPGLTGVAAFDQRSEFKGDDYENTLTVTELAGTPLLGEQIGDVTVLMSSYD